MSPNRFKVLLGAAVVLAATILPAGARPREVSDQQRLVNEARAAFRHLRDDPNLPSFRRHEKEALGFLIVPKAVRASFFIGGAGGRAILVAKNDAGTWSGPSFYRVGMASAGIQAGVDVSEIVVFVMTRRGMDALLSPSVRMGIDASVAAGPVGVGAGSSPRSTDDFVYYSRSKGLYAGASLTTATIRPENDWNAAYYRRPVSTTDIVVRGSVRNPNARPLLEVVEVSVKRS
jgi:lipid-binding SYLF domain-containing protein